MSCHNPHPSIDNDDPCGTMHCAIDHSPEFQELCHGIEHIEENAIVLNGAIDFSSVLDEVQLKNTIVNKLLPSDLLRSPS